MLFTSPDEINQLGSERGDLLPAHHGSFVFCSSVVFRAPTLDIFKLPLNPPHPLRAQVKLFITNVSCQVKFAPRYETAAPEDSCNISHEPSQWIGIMCVDKALELQLLCTAFSNIHEFDRPLLLPVALGFSETSRVSKSCPASVVVKLRSYFELRQVFHSLVVYTIYKLFWPIIWNMFWYLQKRPIQCIKIAFMGLSTACKQLFSVGKDV